MTSWPSKFKTHGLAIKALDAILTDLQSNPTRDYPALRYLADLIPRAPEKKLDRPELPALDMTDDELQMET